MIRRPPRSTRTDTLFPYTTLFRSDLDVARLEIRTDTEFDIRNLFRSERLELSQATSKRRSVYTAGAIAAPRDDIEEQIAIGLPVEPDCPRSEERRVGKAGVSTGRSRWSPTH